MDPARFRRLKDLVAAALELPVAERDRYVVDRCADDAEMLAEVRSLLAQDSSVDASALTLDVAARVGREAVRVSDDPANHPVHVGPYRILGVLGEGGMGTVYRAEQREPIQREVALKVIRRGFGSTSAVARFESERQALAVMDHPHIARVFDAGSTDAGLPYFAMELVVGAPITRYCDEHRLSLDVRLGLFKQVCHAVQHAHQRGIIHRDLKPSNILVTEVDGAPAPRIIDFGVAKATDLLHDATSPQTEVGTLLGTLEYMSPEQAGAADTEVDTRADIYSLGVLLYELVSGQLPFDPAAFRAGAALAAQRMIVEDDPPLPSLRLTQGGADTTAAAAARATSARTLRRRVKGDLDWVVMKALEKNPDRRYQSAYGLAVEIQRFQRHEPVTAGPPTLRYRARKFVRRHRVGVLAAAAVLVAILVGSGLAVSGFVRATEQQRRAEAEVATTGAINEFLTDMLVSVQPDKARGHEVTVREILVAAAEKMDDDERFGDAPEVEAALSFTIGDTYLRLGDYDLALQFLERSLAIRRRTLGETDKRVVEVLDSIGEVQWQTGDLEAALATAQAILAIREQSVGRLHGDYSGALNNVGNTYADMGRYDEAETYLREALAIDREILTEEQGAQLAVSLNNLGALLSDQKKFAEAVELHRESLELRRRFHGEPSPAVITALNNLGFAQIGLGEYEAAERTLRDAARDTELIFGEEHPQTALAWTNLAGALRPLEDFTEAETLLRRAIPIFTASVGERNWRTGSAHSSLGVTLTDLGRYDEAEPELLLSREILLETYDEDSWQVRGACQSLSKLYELWGKKSLAAEWKARATRDAD